MSPTFPTPCLRGRSLLTLAEFTTSELHGLVDHALELKAEKRRRQFPRRLAQRNIALIFLEPSCRTRASFAVACADEGAHLEVLGRDDLRFGVKESTQDIARVLGRLFDGIAMRADDATIAQFAHASGLPVWNALSPLHHPTQVLADAMTIREAFGHLAGVRIAFVGDGRSNMVTSLALAAERFGMRLTVVAPPARQPGAELRAAAPSMRVCADIAAGVDGADVVYGDIWVSMGHEQHTARLIAELAPYRITADVLRATGNPRAIFLHCLPALHDDQTQFARTWPGARDVDDEVLQGPASRVFDQSENRMHTIKALMVQTVAGAGA
ncbi:MAG TPA: ornithine carbamoyltransferase [Burkholderiaceae bacterium]